MHVISYRITKTKIGWNLRLNVLDNKKKSIYINGYDRKTTHSILEDIISIVEAGTTYENLKKYERRYPDRE